MNEPLVVSSLITLPEGDLSWTAVRASGPGGQNVNKVSTKVELKFDLARTTALTPPEKARLRALGGHRVDGEGVLTITSQKTREQRRNLDDARDKLKAMIALALVAPVPRKKTRPTRSSKRRRVEGKRLDARKKEARRASSDA